MPTKKETIKNLMNCPRFNGCSANICPLDTAVSLRNKLSGENTCPFTIKKRSKDQKGMKLLALDSILEVIPESNKKMLNRANLRRWHELH